MATDLPAGLTWRKSSFSSDNGTCVELAPVPGGLIAVRDSKNPGGGHLIVSKDLLLAVARSAQ
jgi:hypothetical protein